MTRDITDSIRSKNEEGKDGGNIHEQNGTLKKLQQQQQQHPTATIAWAPTTPDRVWGRLQNVSFTNAKTDRPLVLRLYQAEFEQCFGSATRLSYADMGWSDEEIEQVAELIELGHVPNLQTLDFGATNACNFIGLRGCQALERALTVHGAMSRGTLKTLYMTSNETMGDAGVEILASVIVGQLEWISLTNCNVGDDGCQALADAVRQFSNIRKEKKTTPPLKVIRLRWNPRITPVGCKHLSDIMQHGCYLEELCLTGNSQVGDEGVELLAKNIMLHLKTVDLHGCNVGPRGCQALAREASIAKNEASCRLMSLDLSDNPRITKTITINDNANNNAGEDENDELTQSLCQMVRNCPLQGICLDKNMEDDVLFREKLQSAAENPRFYVSFH